jgi:hypothetical protein
MSEFRVLAERSDAVPVDLLEQRGWSEDVPAPANTTRARQAGPHLA